MAATNLQALAAPTDDPDAWLGLSLFPQPADPVRRELTEKAMKAKPEYGPVATVLANAMDGVEEKSIAVLIRWDSDHALG